MAKGLLKGLAPIVLAGAGLAGCVTYQPKIVDVSEPMPIASNTAEHVSKAPEKGIDMGNGYSAESRDVSYELSQLALMQLGEITATVKQVGWDYEIDETSETQRYGATPEKVYNETLSYICSKVDGNGDKFIGESEVQDYLNKTHGLIWFEDDGEGNPVEDNNF